MGLFNAHSKASHDSDLFFNAVFKTFFFQLKLGELDHAVYIADCIKLYALPVTNIKVHVLLCLYRK